MFDGILREDTDSKLIFNFFINYVILVYTHVHTYILNTKII